MARPSKLTRFADMKEFEHVFEPEKTELREKDYYMKGQWKKSFFKNDNPLTLELGCGRGEYSVGLAQLSPERNFLGMDIKGARMWKGASFALQNNIQNVGFVRARIEFVRNLFAAGEVDEIWITFPDPQPKKPRRRLIHPLFLNQYKEILNNSGRVHLKTDSQLLYAYLNAILKRNEEEAEISTNDLYAAHSDLEATALKTRYEELFTAEGKSITYTQFGLRSDHHYLEPKSFSEGKWI